MDLSKIVCASNPKSPEAEACKSLLTNVQLMSLDKEIKVIMVSSAAAKEGKTTIASNLAFLMAKAGKKTILIDFDARNPSLHKVFDLKNEKGLSNILAGEEKLEKSVNVTRDKKLCILTSGSRISNYAELLNSAALNSLLQELRENFDYIILDTSPATKSADVQIISRYAEGCIYVVAAGKTDRLTVIKGKKILEEAGANILGFVLNKSEVI